MNREQIIEKWNGMTPRERDAWVAEVVFGEQTLGRIRNRHGVRGVIPQYSTDISAAWTVFESFDDFRIQRYETISGTFKYGCRSDFIVDAKWQSASVSLEFAPEAICLAAIIAKLI